MSLKHPEMLALPVKRPSVSYTDRKGRRCGSKEEYLRANHCKQKGYAEFDLATHQSQQEHTSTHCRQTTEDSSGMVWLGILLCGDGWLITDGPLTYNICLAYVNQICPFFKVTQLIKRKIRIFVNMVISRPH